MEAAQDARVPSEGLCGIPQAVWKAAHEGVQSCRGRNSLTIIVV